MKETVKERAILQEKITEGRINGKNAMTVSDINELKGHRGSAVNGVFIAAGRAKTTFASKGDKFKITAVSTTVHSTTKRGIPTIDHFINIFDNGVTRMLEIDHFFIMFFENFL